MNKLDNTLLSVCELFSSIQGEGVFSGYPCFFIRLSGCNLRCSYCDTSYAYGKGKPMSVAELVAAWRKSRIPLVLVTGGEPLMQEGVYELMKELVRCGAECLLETNGALSISRVPGQVVKIVDWKTPGSGFGSSFRMENLRFISKKDQIKFVIISKKDYEWVLNKMRSHFLEYCCQVIISPAFGMVDPEELASWMMQDLPEARLQIQLHKVLWGDRKGT